MRLLRAMVRFCLCSANVVVILELAVRSGSCLACQRWSKTEENSRVMVICPRVDECAWKDSTAD